MNQDYLPYAMLSLQMLTCAAADAEKGQDCHSIERWLDNDDTGGLPFNNCIHFLQCVLDRQNQGTLDSSYLKTQIKTDPPGALRILSRIRSKIHFDNLDMDFLNGEKLCQSLKN